MPTITGMRGTGQFAVDFRPTSYRTLYTMLEPNGSAPLQALLAMMGSEDTDDPKYNHFRDELPSRILQIDNGAGYNASATTIKFDLADDLAFVVTGTMLRNMVTGELLRATADADTGAGTVAVSRNLGSSGLVITDNDAFAIVGHASAEGSLSGKAVSWDQTVDYNYTQIFKTPIEISGTLKETYLRTGSKEQEMITKALKMHMGDIERTFFFGKRHIENPSTANPTRYTNGLFNMIPNVVDAASGFAAANKITEKEFDRLLIEQVFAWGPGQRVVFADPTGIATFQEIAKNRWSPAAINDAYGIAFTRYTTFAGDLLLYLHPLFRQIPSLKGTMVMLDMSALKYKHMRNRDTDLHENIHPNDFDGVKHQYQTEAGLEMTQAKVHTVVKNWLGT